jgi:transposase-like protein
MERVPRRTRSVVAPQSLYNPEIMPRVAKFMCQRGATMAELAQAFKVTETTLYNWLNACDRLLRDAE